MINSKFYTQISKCPVCKGWGNLNKSSTQRGEVCSKCDGKGVFLAWTDNIFFFGAPTFVDYKSRQKVMIIKIITLITSLTLAGVFIYIFGQFIKLLLGI